MSNYLVVVGNSASLTAQDTWVSSRLTGQGHTVTVADDGAAAPADLDITYHAVIFTSTANVNQIGTKYDATSRGVFSLYPYPHSKFTSQVSPSNGTSTTTQYVTATGGDPVIPTGNGTTVTYVSLAALHTYIDSVTLGSGVSLLLAARSDLLTRVTGARYSPGALMSDGTTTAPSRRIRFGFDDVTQLNANGQTWFDSAVTWVTTALANQTPVANAGPDQAVGSAALVTLDGSASSDADGTIASYLWSQISGPAVTLSSTTVAQPTFTAPSALTGSTLVFGLTVTDNQSATSTQDTVTITVTAAAQVKVRIGGVWVTKQLKARKSGAWTG